MGAVGMTLIVGGIGAEWLQTGHTAAGLLLQIPFYALVALSWGLLGGGTWLARYYLLATAAAIAFTEGLYFATHGSDAALQLGEWAAGLLTSRHAEWIFGLPAILWLSILFAAGPVVTLWRWSAEKADGRPEPGIWLFGAGDQNPSDHGPQHG